MPPPPPSSGRGILKGEVMNYNKQYLINLYCGRFKYSGHESTAINPDMFEQSFLNLGFSAVSESPQGLINNVRATLSGVSPYNMPTTLIVANPVLGDWTRVIGNDCVVGYDNIDSPTSAALSPFIERLNQTAAQLDEIDIDISVNLQNLKTAKIYNVNSEGEREKINQMLRRVDNGQPAIRVTNDLMSIVNNNQVYTADINFLVNDYIIARQNIISRYLTEIGIRSNLLTKKERLTDGEIDVASHEADHNREFYYSRRKHFIEEVNKMFGTALTVDWVYTDEELQQKNNIPKDEINIESEEIDSELY